MAQVGDFKTAHPSSQLEHEAPLCSAYIQAKGRPCRFRAAPGSEYCYSHRTEIGTLRRVPCPLDPRHFVHEAQLKRHLAKCPARLHEEQTANLPFFKKSCNLPPPGEQDARARVQPLADEDWAQWEELIDSALAAAMVRLFPEDHCKWTKLLQQTVCKETEPPGWLQRVKNRIEADGTPADGKHSLQLEELLVRCASVGLLADPARTCILEYGSGKGRLSRWFALAAAEQGHGSPAFVLVERGAHRIKAENRMDVRGAAHRVLRLRMDLADFDLPTLLQPLPPRFASCSESSTVEFGIGTAGEPVQTADKSSAHSCTRDEGSSRASDSRVPAERLQNSHQLADALRSGTDWPPSLTIVCAKHLCGAGTDLALRSLERVVSMQQSECATGCLDFATVLAPCCHHLCEWRLYVNQAFLGETFPDAREAFAVLLSMAPWATEAQCSKGALDDVARIRRERRRLLGVKAKRVLDAGRALWLRESLGFKYVDLSVYADAGVSPENLLVLARRRTCIETEI